MIEVIIFWISLNAFFIGILYCIKYRWDRQEDKKRRE